MALKKLEYFIKPTSTILIADAITTVVTALNSAQEATTNKPTSTTYKDDYFAGLFDTRTKISYLVFSDIAKTKNGMSASYVDVTPSGGSVDLSGYATKEYVDSEIDGISTGVSTYVIE